MADSIVFAAILVIAVGLLALFDLAALRWGVDSRPQLPDDHRR